MTKNLTILASILFLLIGCSKDNGNDSEPTNTGPKAKLILTGGNNQSGTYGEYLPNDLEFKIILPEGKKFQNYYLQFAMIQGNGIINGNTSILSTELNIDGILKTKWQLGCNNTTQKVRVYLYDYEPYNASGKNTSTPNDSIDVQAAGEKPKGWGKACGCGEPDIFRTQIATYDNKTLYMAARNLYSSTDNGMNWDKVANVPAWSDVIGVQFNSKGWIYVLTKNDGVFFSKDLKNWQAINNGILDKRDPTGFMVKDDILMVSFYFDGPYLTINNGSFWQKLLVSTNSQRYMLFNQHTDGSLYLFDDWGTLFVSKDLGNKWQAVQPDCGYYLSQPSGFAIGKDGNLYIGANDAIIAQISPTTYKGIAKRYYQYNASSQSIGNIQPFDNDVFYLVKSTPTPGIYSMKNNWSRIELGFSKTIYSYFTKTDGNFLLLGDDGLYYRN